MREDENRRFSSEPRKSTAFSVIMVDPFLSSFAIYNLNSWEHVIRNQKNLFFLPLLPLLLDLVQLMIFYMI